MGGSLFGLEERQVSGRDQLAARAALLASRALAVPGGEDLILGLYDGDSLVATGALVGNVIQGIAVDPGFEGEGAAAAIVSSLIKHAVDRNIDRLSLYTSAYEAERFEDMGFSPIAEVPGGAALLEWGERGIASWLEKLKEASRGKPAGAGAAVVNCNPFTWGHRKLLESAASRTPWLYVLVVEEDRSLFPFALRLELVRQGTADLPNVTVIAGGPYIISSATFPTYFIRPSEGDGVSKGIAAHAALDLAVFRRHIAPALGVTDRFVGTEPYCATTSIYNATMKKVLAESAAPGARRFEGPPLTVHEMPRFELDGVPVSASRVRELIRKGSLAEVETLVPPTTWAWLNSRAAGPVIEKIRSSDSRH
ncbi:MAG: [citrate (pro-3S)-lyase] ligase [Spirochaetes bacterium]|nr:[citrate (pro-3S)-lyase] ligase [Spirochaetota bacterium]